MREKNLLGSLLTIVCIITAAAHWPALSAKALSFDDYQYLTENVLVQNPGWTSTQRFLTEVLAPSTVRGYYQPLSMISLMLDCALGGSPHNLRQFHCTSLALHTVNTALIIVLLYLLFDQVWIAAAVGLFFGVHPMTVEPVPWIGERKTLLAAFFALLCLISYVRYARTNTARYYIASLATYILALMSKPTSVALPVVMLLMDYWPLNRIAANPKRNTIYDIRNTILEKLPFFAFGVLSAVVTYISQSRTASVILPAMYEPMHIPLTLCHNIIFYLYKIVWPTNMSSFYAIPEPMSLSNPMVLAGVIGTAVLIPLLLFSLRWTRALLTGWLIFFVAILPTMQIIGFSDVIASDKFAYLPAIGFMMILAWLFGSLWKVAEQKLASIKPALITLVLLLSAGEVYGVRQYLAYWQDSVTLYEYMLKQAPNAAAVHDNLGIALKSIGNFEGAVSHFQEAGRLNPYHAYRYSNNLGIAYINLGRYQDAVETYKQAIKIKPDLADAYCNLGVAYVSLGRYQEAVPACEQAIEIKPDYAEAYCNLGVAYINLDRYQEAIQAWMQAIKINPDFAEAYCNLGCAYEKHNCYREAIDALKQAVRIKPDYVEAHLNLGVAYLTAGDKIAASQECKILKELNTVSADRLSDLINKVP